MILFSVQYFSTDDSDILYAFNITTDYVASVTLFVSDTISSACDDLSDHRVRRALFVRHLSLRLML